MKKEEEFDKEGQLVKTTIVTEAKVEKSKYNKAADWIDLIVKSASIFTIALALLTYFDSLSESKKKEQRETLQSTRDSLENAYKQLRDVKGDSLADMKFRHEEFAFDTTFKMEQLRFLSQQASETKRQTDEQKRFNESLAFSIAEANQARAEDRLDQFASRQYEQYLKVIQVVTSILSYEYGSPEYSQERSTLFGALYGGILLVADSTVQKELDKLKLQISFYETFSKGLKEARDLDNTIVSIREYSATRNLKLVPQKEMNNNIIALNNYLANGNKSLDYLNELSVSLKAISSNCYKYPQLLTTGGKGAFAMEINILLDSIVSNDSAYLKSISDIIQQYVIVDGENYNVTDWSNWLLGVGYSWRHYSPKGIELVKEFAKGTKKEQEHLQENSIEIAEAMKKSNLFTRLQDYLKPQEWLIQKSE